MSLAWDFIRQQLIIFAKIVSLGNTSTFVNIKNILFFRKIIMQCRCKLIINQQLIEVIISSHNCNLYQKITT